MAELPPGFVLDTTPAPAAAPPPVAGLPEGFVLDQAPAPAQPKARWKGGMLPISEGPDGKPQFDSNAGIFGIVKDIAKSAYGGATLPGDVYTGKVDPMSDEAIGRSFDLAQFATPLSVANKSRMVMPAPQSPVARDAAEAGVTLTTGQRTGQPSLLAREDAMLGGGLGGRAQDIAQAAKARQTEELFRAREAVGDMAGRGINQLERPADAGGIVADAVKANAAASKLNYQDKYRAAFSGQGGFKPETFNGMSARVTESLVSRPEPVIIDDVLTPAANRALGELDKIQNLKLGTIGQPAAGEAIEGVNLRGVDQARRKLAAFAKAAQTPTDKRAVSEIIKEFDGQITKAVEDGLFTGDETFLAALKDARGAFASYQRTFNPQGAGDDVGRVMRTMVERDVTPEQVANYIFGSSKVGANSTNVRVAGRLKELLGPDSPEWSAVRQAAWQKLVNAPAGATPMGPQKASQRIAEFLDGEGRSFARQLFSADELNAMRRHASIEKALASKPGTANPPNSGNRLAQLARDSLATIGGMLGMSTGGPQGAAAGYAAGKAAGAIGDIRNAAQARRLFNGQDLAPSLGARVTGAGAGATRQLAPAGTIELLERQSRE